MSSEDDPPKSDQSYERVDWSEVFACFVLLLHVAPFIVLIAEMSPLIAVLLIAALAALTYAVPAPRTTTMFPRRPLRWYLPAIREFVRIPVRIARRRR